MAPRSASPQRDEASRGWIPSSRPSLPQTVLSRISLGAVVLAVLPVAVATVRALLRHQLPVGDNALIAIRAADVGTENHPLLGTWSSASLSTGTEVHHPGPLFLDLLALPVRVLGPEGVALGVGLVNVVAIIGVALAAARRGGALLMAVATGIAAALSWTLGSQLLVEPWQPHALLLPFFLFLMLVWSASCGDATALPWAAAVGSLVLQTHLSYSLLVPALGGWALLWLVLGRRRHGGTPEGQRQMGPALLATGLVLALCWAQPLWEQFSSGSSGNLHRLLAGAGGDGYATLGFRVAARMMASVLTLPSWWLKPSFKDAWLRSGSGFGVEQSDLPSFGVAAAALFVLAALLAAGWWIASGHEHHEERQALATAAWALLVGFITAAIVPAGVFGVAPHQFRWLWPLSAFTTFAVAVIGVRRLGSPTWAWRVTFAAVAITIGLVVLTLPTGEESPASPARAVEVATELGDRMGDLEGEGPLLVRPPAVFNDPYATAMMAELQHRGIPFLIERPLAAQLGGKRVDNNDGRARALMTFGFGDEPDRPPGARKIAQVRTVAVFLTPLD